MRCLVGSGDGMPVWSDQRAIYGGASFGRPCCWWHSGRAVWWSLPTQLELPRRNRTPQLAKLISLYCCSLCAPGVKEFSSLVRTDAVVVVVAAFAVLHSGLVAAGTAIALEEGGVGGGGASLLAGLLTSGPTTLTSGSSSSAPPASPVENAVVESFNGKFRTSV